MRLCSDSTSFNTPCVPGSLFHTFQTLIYAWGCGNALIALSSVYSPWNILPTPVGSCLPIYLQMPTHPSLLNLKVTSSGRCPTTPDVPLFPAPCFLSSSHVAIVACLASVFFWSVGSLRPSTHLSYSRSSMPWMSTLAHEGLCTLVSGPW